jgi:hypothetical protein
VRAEERDDEAGKVAHSVEDSTLDRAGRRCHA